MINLMKFKKGFVNGHPQKTSQSEKDYYSADGEDGVVEQIFMVLNITKGSVVELGAGTGWWDDVYHSNIYKWIKQGWPALLIEGDPSRLQQLEHKMDIFPHISYDNSFITLKKSHDINTVLEKHLIPKDFDLLSIDIDGNDHWVWNNLKYEPKVVIIEYNSNWDRDVAISYEETHIWDQTQYFGASAKTLERLGNQKGYDLVAFCKRNNLVFVRSDLNKKYFMIMNMDDKHLYIEKEHHKKMADEKVKKLISYPSFGGNNKQ